MVFKVLCILVYASVITNISASPCEIKNYQSGCRYDVKCTVNTGSISNPACDYEPYVIFTVVNSNLNYLTGGFFTATNFDSRVKEFYSVNNSWTTIDTASLRYYSRCEKMDLSNTNIQTINKDAFRGLNYVKFLNLSFNNIESFVPRSFFISEGRRDLQELDLSNNKLLIIDSELNGLPNLKTLHLKNNKLAHISDDAFDKLKNLSTLYLQHNFLTSLNLSLIHAKSLENLDLSYNNLLKLSGYEVNRLEALVNFNVSHNNLVSVDFNCFGQAVNLATVDFSFNNIKMKLQYDMFISNRQLKYLNFYNNQIESLEENAFQHCDLNYLNLENNNITGDIKENTFSNLRNLSKFDISQQRITGIRNNAFVDMESLQSLNISKNLISTIESSAFANTSIIILDLSYNKINDLFFMKNHLFNLTELYINNNNITTLPKNTFLNQTQIKKLDLSMNHIISIEEYSLPLNNLQYLNIVGNKINGVLKPNLFSPAQYLRFLDLSDFNITKIQNFAFDGLPVLAKLNLSNNNIQYIGENSFNNIDNLFSLDLSYNKLIEFKLNSSKLPNVRALHLRNNKLANTSKLLSNRSKLSYLDLSSNNITNVTGLQNYLIPNLTVLYLNNNNIKNFNNPNTNSLTSLIDLGLSSNEISQIKLSYFKELMSVDLSNNNIIVINITLLEENQYLQSLDLSRNGITDLPPGTFQHMKNLKLVNLSSNYLTKLRYGSLKGLHKTEILDLSKNLITSLDVDVFHECEELKTLIIDYNRIKTFDVERLILIAAKKLRTLSLGGNPILCKEIVRSIKSTNVTFYAVRQVEVTSVDKIYHEDNVHGIKCGDEPTLVTNDIAEQTPPSVKVNKDSDGLSSTTIALIWCLVLTIVIISGIVVILYKKRLLSINRHSGVHQLQDSVYQSDLLD